MPTTTGLPKRILHAASYHGATAGGVIPMILRLAREIVDRGGAFALVAPRNAAATWHASVAESGAELILVDDAAGALRAIRAWDPDLVHVHFYGWDVAVPIGLWLRRPRIVFHVHSALNRGGRIPQAIRFFVKFRLVGARIERYLAVSDAIASELAAVGVAKRKIATVRNVVDSERFRPPTLAERARARAALGLGDARAILFFGWEPRRKGADVLFEALAELEDVTVITVATPAETRSLLAQRATVVAFERVDDVVPLLWAADVLAVPSRAEGLVLVLLEATLAGLAVAASDLPTMREAAAGSTRVRFSPVGDGRRLAESIRELFAAPAGETRAGDEADSLGTWAAAVLRVYRRE